MTTPVVLTILDGWGMSPDIKSNAIRGATLPNWTHWTQTLSLAALEASSTAVGLPQGQMGNSEVGHLTIGAGRVIWQDLPRIHGAVASHQLDEDPSLLAFIKKIQKTKGHVHLMGLVSDGGVHSHIDHLLALGRIFENHHVPVHLHAWLDGRDTPPQSAAGFLKDPWILKHLTTFSGRYYAMDRDQRWERTHLAYDAIINGTGPVFEDVFQILASSYSDGIYDEFIPPHRRKSYGGVSPEDGILCFNFRADRMVQLCEALFLKEFTHFERSKGPLSNSCLTMTPYKDTLAASTIPLFSPQPIHGTLVERVEEAHLQQLHIAETEKYAHVTYFFNGGKEKAVSGETRILIPSPKVKTYDLAPAMSAWEITHALQEALLTKKYALVVVNFAGADMVGHTGNYEATVQAVEVIDACLGKIAETCAQTGALMVITADHGNAEQMQNPKTGDPHTAHTCYKVPFLVVGKSVELKQGGTLADVAPTVLELMGLSKPAQMTGTSLLVD